MKAKKFIENKKEGEYEIIRNHIIDIPVDKTVLNDLVEDLKCYDDSEMAFMTYGICLNWDCDEIYCLDINKFLEGLETYLEEDDDAFLKGSDKELIETLKKYPGYDLYPD
jgi:hypothetical protein